MVRLDIISIGTLSRNRLWNESEIVRTPHATTTLLRAGKRNILIDPSLPPPVIKARLFERAGLQPEKIDTIFLTNFRPAHRGGLELFPNATLLIHEPEKDFATQYLNQLLERAKEAEDDVALIQRDLKLLARTKVADDQIADSIDLFPLPGYTPGTCGLLVTSPTTTTLIAGDAVPTLDHFLAAQVLPDSSSIEQAQESLKEAYEIADLVVPGHDNLFINPRMQGLG